MKFLDPNDPEIAARKKALRSLMSHLDSMLGCDEQSEMGESDETSPEESILNKVGMPKKMMDNTEDHPQLDVEVPGVGEEIAEEMAEDMDAQYKYKARVPVGEKGKTFIVNKRADAEAPMPSQKVRRMGRRG